VRLLSRVLARGAKAGPRTAGHRNAVGPLKALLVASVGVPLLLFAGAAWLSHRDAYRAAWERIERIEDTVGEHAIRVFQTHELVLDRIADRTADMDWPTIRRSHELSLFLREIREGSPQISRVGLVEPDRRVALTDGGIPPPGTYAHERNFTRVPRAGNDEDLFISDVSTGESVGRPQFSITRYKPNSAHTPQGGMIFVSVRPEYLARYYEDVLGDTDLNITLVRADGAILARFPEPRGPSTLPPTAGMMQQLQRGIEAGRFEAVSFVDGTERLFVFKKLLGYPVYVNVGITREAVDGAWLRRLAGHLIYGVPATLAMIATTLVALYRTRREQEALALARSEEERRKQAEAEIRQAQKMEAIGQLTGGVAHDFNNLLTAVVGNLELLERHVSSDAGRRLLAAAQRGITRGEQLTHSLLAFARRQTLRPEVVNANRLVKEFGDLLQRATGEAVEVQFVLSTTLDPCLVDPGEFQSALLNLVVNARDAMPSGGKITIQTENVALKANAVTIGSRDVPAGNYVVVAVGDTGEGMSAKVAERAFEPFFTTKEVGKGSGLGLSQVYGFVKQSGGYVQIESEPAVGTTVRLYLPRSTVVSAPLVAPRPAVEPPRSPGQETILVVEDDPDVRDVVALRLRDLGYHVLTAEDGREALTVLRSDPSIDLIFTDLVMPNGVRGDDLVRRAREFRTGLRVVLTSGYPASVEPLAWDALGGEVGFLAKPYKAEELARVIRAALGTHEASAD
jgi:two-component system NtrC family sensor kinase